MNQRKEKKRYEAGLKTTMNDEKLQHLSDMDFQWNGKAANIQKERNSAVWDQRLEELTKFKEEHGHCRVPRKGKFGIWVNNQRNRKTTRVARTKEKTAKLEAIGFFDS
jgi:hypothetical protein